MDDIDVEKELAQYRAVILQNEIELEKTDI
jgi:hypothetical protein